MDTLSRADVANIVASEKGRVKHLVHNHNGNHVIQKSIMRINELVRDDCPTAGKDIEEMAASRELLLSSLGVIIDEITESISDLSMHPYGCRVVQRLIEHCSGPQQARVLDSVVVGIPGADGAAAAGLLESLVEHEYGNYVVQRVLAHGRMSDREAAFNVVRSNVLRLSTQKHSSNVVEMMLTYGDADQRHDIVEEMLTVSMPCLW